MMLLAAEPAPDYALSPRCRIGALGRADLTKTGFSSVALRGALASDLAALAGPAVAIVGARAASYAALQFARGLAKKLAEAGVLVVSGGALGVDGAAHEGALDVGGRTVIVMGTGIDVVYPERHADLFARAAVRGLLVSPFPDGERAATWSFPKRNALIAGLADATVVVQAGFRSGSLGTATAARKLGRRLYARPGSPGCDALLGCGHAQAVPSIEETFAALMQQAPPAPTAYSDLEIALHAGPRHAEELSHTTGTSLDDTLASLCELEIEGRVLHLADGRYLALSGQQTKKE